MKNLTLLLLLLLTIITSCSVEQEKNAPIEKETKDRQQFTFSADSLFLVNFKTGSHPKVEALKNTLFGNNEAIYELLKKKVIYRELKSFSFTEKLTAKIVYADFSAVHMDGTLKIFFLVLYDPENKELSNYRIAKSEMISDISNFETCIVNEDGFKKKSTHISINDKGELQKEIKLEEFEIMDDGRIILKK